ncbi:MAG: glycosyltransferase, partial [Desulfobacterales bacterium]
MINDTRTLKKNNTTSISIIIPAYNETDNIGHLVATIKDLYPDFEIIVVNDGSTDNTGTVAKDAGAKVYSHPYNIGNGAAV